MIPVPSASEKPLKPILRRNPSGVRKAVTFSATNSQVFFADDWDRSAVEVVSKLSYSDVLELKQLSLDSLPSDRHASMGLSPLLSHVPLTLCPLACEEPKISASPKSESQPAPPSPAASSPLVIPDLSILASPASVNETLRGSPTPLSPPSSEAASSPPVSLGTISPHSSASSPESSPPKPNVKLTAPVPVRRPLMMNFMPLLPEPGSELPSPVLSADSSLSDDSTDTEETASTLAPQTPVTPHTPHTPTSLSPIPASPTSPTSFNFAPQQTQGPPTGRTNKSRASRAEIAQFSALSGSTPGELGAVGLQPPRKSADGKMSPVSPISPGSDSTVSVSSSALVRPVPRRAFTSPVVKDVEPPAVTKPLVRRDSFGSVKEEQGLLTRTKTSRSFDDGRTTRLAITSAAWADGVPLEKEESGPVARPPSVQSFRPALSSSSTPAPTSTPSRPAIRTQHRSHSLSDVQAAPLAQPQSTKYVNPYAQIREQDEPRPVPTIEEPLLSRRSIMNKTPQRTRTPASGNAKSSLPPVPRYDDDVLGLGLTVGSRPPSSMTRPSPAHRASVHGYPFSSGRPPSPTPTFSRPNPSPLFSTVSLPGTQTRSGQPLASKDANVRSGGSTTGSSYTLGLENGLGVSSSDRKPRSTNDKLPSDKVMPPLCAPLARPKNSKISR